MIPLLPESSHPAHLVDSVPNALQYSARAIRQVAGGRDGLTPLGWVGLIFGYLVGKAIVALFVLGLIVRAVSAIRESLSGALSKPKHERYVGRHLADDVPVRHARRVRHQRRST